jgi:Flp pilus assembly protein TadG
MRTTARDHHNVSPRSERGQSTVELALAFPVLLLILMGVLDFGRAFFSYVSITNAAREGAQYGTWYPTDANGNTNLAAITTQVNQELDNTGISPVTVGASCLDYYTNATIDCSSAHIGDRIGVTVSYNFGLLTTGILPFGNSIPMSSFATMAIINGQCPSHPSIPGIEC